jgi:hypothetical protein
LTECQEKKGNSKKDENGVVRSSPKSEKKDSRDKEAHRRHSGQESDHLIVPLP